MDTVAGADRSGNPALVPGSTPSENRDANARHGTPVRLRAPPGIPHR